MIKTLNVYLHRHLVGQLTQNKYGEVEFCYSAAWLESSQAVPLSNSLPIRKEKFRRRECKGFFSGILPEENNRQIIAKNLGISAQNDFSMLSEIGGECAGAITFLPSDVELPERNDQYRRLQDQELEVILKKLPERPLMAGEAGVRLSLAGAQDKIAVALRDHQFSIPLNGAASTHILKPAIKQFPGLSFNEAFCMQTAAAIGLNTAKTGLGNTNGIDYLLIERYDRKLVGVSIGNQFLERIHQEDFCQALGIESEKKYQVEGGPSLPQSFSLLRQLSSAPVIDLQQLLDAIIFNFLIGNNDAHGKNFSLLYNQGTVLTGNSKRLSPFYDILSTAYYPELSKKMAMNIGGEYLSERIKLLHFEKLAEEIGFSKLMVKRRVVEMMKKLLFHLDTYPPQHSVTSLVAQFIYHRCQRLAQEFKPID